MPRRRKDKNDTTKRETEKETEKTVDPDILKRIKEMKENG